MSATIIETIEAILKANTVRVAKYSIAPRLDGSQKIKTARLRMLVRISLSIRGQEFT